MQNLIVRKCRDCRWTLQCLAGMLNEVAQLCVTCGRLIVPGEAWPGSPTDIFWCEQRHVSHAMQKQFTGVRLQFTGANIVDMGPGDRLALFVCAECRAHPAKFDTVAQALLKARTTALEHMGGDDG